MGVSQFSLRHLHALMKHKQKHIPLSVVRDWRDPLHPNTGILGWCDTNNVQFQAFSPLGGQQLAKTSVTGNPILKNPTIKRIAKNNNMTPAQVVIKWNMQYGVGVVIRTSNLEHLSENLNTFDQATKNKNKNKNQNIVGSLPLSEQDIHDIDALGYSKNTYNPKKEPIKFTIPADGQVYVESGDGSVVNSNSDKNKKKQKEKERQERRAKFKKKVESKKNKRQRKRYQKKNIDDSEDEGNVELQDDL